jgi:hypothetical protein
MTILERPEGKVGKLPSGGEARYILSVDGGHVRRAGLVR